MEIKVPRGQEFFKDGSLHYTLVGEIKFDPKLENRLNARLGVGSPFQKFWDNMLLTDMEPYIPKLTGMLINSGILNTVIGSGYLVWRTPYARRQYYEGREPGTSQEGALRGRLWGLRSMNDLMPQWTRSAQLFIQSRRG